MSLIEKIQSRGHWQGIIRPTGFDPQRVPTLATLEKTVAEAQVRLRGWDYPHTRREGPVRGEDWIRSEDEFEHHLDAWQMFQSGMFVHYRGIHEDWRDQSRLWPATQGWKAGELLGATDTLFTYTEIYEFAARLGAARVLGDGEVVIQTTLRGLDGRALYLDDPQRAPFMTPKKAAIPAFNREQTLALPELLGAPRELAAQAAVELFARFGWDTTPERMREMQAELR